MSSNAVDDDHVNAAAAYVGRVSAGGSLRSEKAVLLVTNVGLALHRPGHFEKYRDIPYEEINFFDLRRRWNGMVLSIGADGGEFRFRFFRPRGDLAAIVVSLNQRLQSNRRPLRPRYALTQVSIEEDADPCEPSPNLPEPQGAVEQLSGDAASGSGAAGQLPSLRADWSRPETGARRSGSATRVFAGDRTNFAPLIRTLPKLIMFCLALYSVVVSGLWQRGIDTIAGLLLGPEQEKAATQPVVVEEPSSPEVPNPPAPAEDNLAHVRIDLSQYPNLAELLKTQRSAMNMSQTRAAKEAHLDPSTVERIEAASEVVSLAAFLKYAKIIHLDVRIIKKIIDRQ